VGITPEPHDPGIGEQLPAPGDPGLERPGQSPAGHHGLHEARIDLLQRIKTEPESLQNSRAEIVYNDVVRSHQLLEKFLAFGMAQVKGAAKLGAIHVGVSGRLTIFTWNNGRFDLDNFHAVVRQDGCSERPSILLREIDHAQTFEHGLTNAVISHDWTVGMWSNACHLSENLLSMLI